MIALPRRSLLAGTALALTLRPLCAQTPPRDSPLDAAIRTWAGGVMPRDGRVSFEVPALVDNGNGVPITVRVDSPMTEADHVREIAVFNERNPLRDVLRCQLSPANGRAEVGARIRLATSQRLAALARMSDGSIWQQRVDVLVTLAACIES